jgi:5-methylcytosine-specific restriction endonuclease McrA
MTTTYTPPSITTLPLDARMIVYPPADLRPDGYPTNWPDIATAVKLLANGRCEHCHHPHDVPSGHVLTVHHINMLKHDCRYQNLIALCQRCHLHLQHRYRPDQPRLLGDRPTWAAVRGLP